MTPRPIPSPQNPSVCAEERKPRRNRARDCLSAASSSGTPAGLSTGRCPQRSEGTQTVGSPFFGLPYFGEAKKGKSPAAATERHQDSAKYPTLNPKTKQIRKRAFLRSEPKFAKPVACPAGAALRCATKLRSDPKNQAARRLFKCFRPIAAVVRA